MTTMLSRSVLKRGFSSSNYFYSTPRVKLTFFSKPQCGLCEQAKEIIDDVLEEQDFKEDKVSMEIVNINQLNNKKWWELYCFDIPVLHVEKIGDPTSLFKIFHRIEEDVLEEKLKTYLK
ncbi:Uncharacterized protein RNJ44_00824 [Nakaseomyces bracarensis]|uniref:Glutaredoxin-like protein n=1 Tax=Nakaseomyces bracarensis TaxID=273131 RepID=A0ABR4NS79_9SACH